MTPSQKKIYIHMYATQNLGLKGLSKHSAGARMMGAVVTQNVSSLSIDTYFYEN